MTPLMQLILRALRAAALVAAGLVVLFIAIEVTKHYLLVRIPEGRDLGFLAVLLVILIAALFLVRAITRELRK